MTARIIHGDCKEVLKTMEADSMDAMVTDPPAGIAFMGKAWDSFESLVHFQDEMAIVFRECLRILKPGAHGLVWALPRTSHHTGMALERAGFELRDMVLHLFGTGMPKGQNVAKAGAGDAWEGWNTTLKPSHEVWWLVRKPLSEKTVVAQVLATGTGAINVDGCRVDFQSEADQESAFPGGKLTSRKVTGGGFGAGWKEHDRGGFESERSKGRWPANAVLSHSPECKDGRCVEGCPVTALDEQSGFLHGAGNRGPISRAKSKDTKSDTTYGQWKGLDDNPNMHANDGGGASRFFYTSKVPPNERDLPDGTTNNHPTAKSVKLMRYFVRLVTPQGGTVLDPFTGSGTTGVAALQEGMSFVGIELDPEHHRVAELRIEAENAYKNSIDLHLTLPED
jgi:DNA modification methylase